MGRRCSYAKVSGEIIRCGFDEHRLNVLNNRTVSQGHCERFCPHYDGTAKRIAPTAGPKKPPSAEQVVQYYRAELSLLTQGPVPESVFAERLAGCQSCTLRRTADDGRDYCGECGCGPSERAKLDVKLHMPSAVCPLKPPVWGRAKGEGVWHLRRVGGVWRQIRGVLRQSGVGIRELLAAYRSTS